MKVKELIEKLQKLDPDLPVFTDYCEEGGEVDYVREKTVDYSYHDSGALCMLDEGTDFVAISSHH